MRSLNRTLLLWVLGALALGSLVLVVVAYAFTLAEMNEVMDENLRDVAGSVAQYHTGGRAAPPGGPARQAADEGDIVTRVWRPDGSPLFSSDATVPLPFDGTPGARAVVVQGEEWRTQVLREGDAIVQVAQRSASRKQMAGEAASKLLLPLVLLFALVGLLILVALRRGLRPLQGATAEIARRTALTLTPIQDVELPRELRPMVGAFNGLMGRLADAFAMQRRFVADAAHELRTPVAALHLQLQLLQQAPDEASRAEALLELRSGVGRMERLVEQLLQLSRSQPDAEQLRRGPVALDELVRSVVTDFSRPAERAGIDLGAVAERPVALEGDVDQLRVLLNNLVRNSLHYCPPGSRVDVLASATPAGLLLEVADNGPGIPAAEIERVFDRFYRGSHGGVRERDPAGSGLGLAIVKAIADRHGAAVRLLPAEGGGLRVQVVFSA